MRIMFIGDICGENARKLLSKLVPTYRKKYQLDAVVANVENAAHGRGITLKISEELLSYGIDAMTSGNHIWARSDYEEILSNPYYKTIRPANYTPNVIGNGTMEVKTPNGNLLVINMSGITFIKSYERYLTEPFYFFENMLENLDYSKYDSILVDLHAEATSEKKSFGLYFDSKVSSILGTHTHIQTSDEQILPSGSSYITDVGMVGPKDSVLWTDKDIIFRRNMYPYHEFFEISNDNNIVFNAVIIESNSSKSSKSIERLNEIHKV